MAEPRIARANARVGIVFIFGTMGTVVVSNLESSVLNPPPSIERLNYVGGDLFFKNNFDVIAFSYFF